MLTPSDAPLVWIDCEMTGLKDTDVLLEISCFVTDARLTLLDKEGYNVVISRPKEVLDAMDEWCTRTHGESGLTADVLASTTTAEQAGKELLAYIKRFVPEKRTALLAGNTVHADKVFLVKEMPEVVEYLNYRIVDVSSVKEMARRWAGERVLREVPKKEGKHRGREDILESIEECGYWKRVLFEENRGVGKGTEGA